ncbi:GGDEF domain-containing protein [Actinoplanes sp. NPDC051513]|uniref:GGDEF domain-containing protein n=1 Tax=Actinoplanes sp. NPDC051513 TaxID=3363908 RepID=UPI00379D535B
MRAHVAAYPREQIEKGLSVTISLGVANVAEGDELPEVMTLADRRLYAAKRAGRNRVEAGSAQSSGQAPSRSCTPAPVTSTASSSPQVSTAI